MNARHTPLPDRATPCGTSRRFEAGRRLFALLCLLCTAPPPANAAPVADTQPASATDLTSSDTGRLEYVINLNSSIRPLKIPEIIDNETGEEYIVYTTTVTRDDKLWHRLRVGFFPDKQAATKLLAVVKPSFAGAWIGIATPEEAFTARREAMGQKKKAKKRPRVKTQTVAKAPTRTKTPTRTATKTVVPPQPPAPQPTRASVSGQRIEGLMEEARQAVARNDYARAIQLYTKVLEYPANAYSQDALEFLGVAREKNGQTAHAIKLYQEYLAMYPEGDGHERVQQRLDGLTTFAKKVAPRRAGRSAEKPSPWDVYGGASVYYRRDEDTTSNVEDPVTQSSLTNSLDLTTRRRTRNSDIQARFSGSYLHDFLDDGAGDSTSVSSLYVAAIDKRHGLSMKLGRQSRNSGGVLGRIDGLLLGYQASDWFRLNTVAGFPVQSTRDQVKTDRYLYGVSADIGPFSDAWDFNVFLIEQQANGLLDRRAVGGEVRFFEPGRSMLTFADYDISYGSLNTFIFLGNWRLKNKTTINASVDYRNSPLLTTTNALQGQSVPSLDDLENDFTESQIRRLAEDRTAKSQTFTLGASHPFTEKLQLDGDVTVSKLSNTQDSGDLNGDGIDDGVATPGTNYEIFYNTQLVGSSLIKSGDIAILGLRYSDAQSADTTTLSLNTRFPLNRAWRLNPRVRVDYRVNAADDTEQWIYRPEIRTDFRWRRKHRFEFELGGEWSDRELVNGSEETSSYFLRTGYRADF